tara:strand:- start:2666 stop:2902 length:237 start_codon:yes stop_codon:yes gene_type:complete
MTPNELQALMKILPERCSPANLTAFICRIIVAYDMTGNWPEIMLATTVTLGEFKSSQNDEAITDANSFLERIVNEKNA